jgi:hypothetical protein
MLTDSQQLKKNTKYWYSCAYFKHSQGQLSKTYRLQSPIPVHVSVSGSSVEAFHWLADGSKGSKIWHPNYYNFSSNGTYSTNFFGNFIFDNEEEAWCAYQKGIEQEIERTEDLCKLKVDVYKNLLKGKKNK